jgi:hypothetical protein
VCANRRTCAERGGVDRDREDHDADRECASQIIAPSPAIAQIPRNLAMSPVSQPSTVVKTPVIGEVPAAYTASAYSKPIGIRLNTRLIRIAPSFL